MKSKPVLLFDGVCNLCNNFVQFVIKRDDRDQIRFASLQSEVGKALIKDHEVNIQDLSTVVLVSEDGVYTHSDVALEIAKMLGNGWQFFYVLKLIPQQIRDVIYNWIAKNRYRWFGKKESCMMPQKGMQERFLS